MTQEALPQAMPCVDPARQRPQQRRTQPDRLVGHVEATLAELKARTGHQPRRQARLHRKKPAHPESVPPQAIPQAMQQAMLQAIPQATPVV